MQILIWNGKAWISHRLDATSFWLKIIPVDRLAGHRPPMQFGPTGPPARPKSRGIEPAGAAFRAPAVSAAR